MRWPWPDGLSAIRNIPTSEVRTSSFKESVPLTPQSTRRVNRRKVPETRDQSWSEESGACLMSGGTGYSG